MEPLSLEPPIMWCVQEALPLSQARVLQLGPLWDNARGCMVTPLTLLVPGWCWAPRALLCATLAAGTGSNPSCSSTSRPCWEQGNLGRRWGLCIWQGLEGNTE